MINTLEYGVQILSIHANFSLTQKNNASKKQVKNNILLNEAIVDKPFLIKKYIVSYDSTLLKLRRKCNRIFQTCFLMDFFVKTKNLSRKFSSTIEIEANLLKQSILKDLKNEKWPTDCILKRIAINNYIQHLQNQIFFYKKKEQQLDFITSHIFDIKNRIFSIDKIFNNSKSTCYGQFGYSDLILKSHKFILLKQTKLTNISKLPPCKIVTVEIPKTNEGKRSLGISMPIDKVLQRMFLNFLNVLIEEKVKPNIFAYRKESDAKTAVAHVYNKLNQVRDMNKICVCLISIEKCFNSLFHNQIIEQYPFPKSYDFLLSRWLTPNLIDKSCNFKNLGKIKRGIFQNSILGQSIVNLLLSNAFPKNIFKKHRENAQKVWTNIFFYADNIILISNNSEIFYHHLTKLRKNLKKIGLSFNNTNTKSFVFKKSKIRFQFLGFDFLIISKNQLKRNLLFFNMKNLHSLKKSSKNFAIILRPSPKKVKDFKKRLKIIIKKILHKPRNKIYKSFQWINFLLLGWSSYYYFSQECIYEKRIYNYVFSYLKKILVKKFRYNGLLRPKWVAYHFLGLNKINPNGKKWQPRALQYIKKSSKISNYIYIWSYQNSISKLSITSFLLNSKTYKKI